MDFIKQFKKEREGNIKKNAKNKKLKKAALDFFTLSWKEKYSYNFDWLGIPIIQIPQDVVAMQEIIWQVKPDLIIETGIARGGSLIFYASMLEVLGKGKVLGVDVDIRKHNKKAIESHPMHKRIQMIEGSSVDGNMIKQVERIAKKYKKVLVVLDSLHTHDHVLEELRLYAPLVSKESYCVVFDTMVEYMPKDLYKDRPWGRGNNPATAVKVFMKNNKNFLVDQTIDNTLLITSAYGGYLKRI